MVILLKKEFSWRSVGHLSAAIYIYGCSQRAMFSPTVDRNVPKIPGNRQIHLQGGGARQHL